MKKKTVQLALGATLLVGVFAAQAQLPVSRSAGIELTDLTAGQFHFVSVARNQEPLARGVVTSVSTDDVTLSVPAGTFTGLVGEYAAQIVTSADTGATFEVDEANSTGTTVRLTGYNAASPSVTTGSDEIVVVKKQTLDTAFPSGGSFTGSTSPGSADLVYIGNGSGSLITAYYNTTSSAWLNSVGGSPVGSTALPLNGSVLVKAAATPGDALVKGIVPSGKQVVPFAGSGQFTFVGNPFGSLILDDLTSSVTAGASAGVSDLIYIIDAGTLKIVYRKNDSTWRNSAGDVVVSGTTNIGSGFLIKGVAAGSVAFTEVFTE